MKIDENISLPSPLSTESIDHIVAGLSDQQVRRLLIDELKMRARQEAQTAAGQPKPSGGRENRLCHSLNHFKVSGFRCQRSRWPKKTASLIRKETTIHRAIIDCGSGLLT